MKFYITHYTPLKNRKIHILKQLEYYGITNYEFIETYDREVLTKNDIKNFSCINMAEISLWLKHVEVFKKPEDIIIVLEDDAIFVDNFMDKLHTYMEELKKYDWDIVFTSDCCNLHDKNIIPNKLFYKTNYSRGCAMYIINKNSSKKILSLFENNTISLAIDHWFNKQSQNLNMFWSEPVLVKQGSETSLFESTIK